MTDSVWFLLQDCVVIPSSPKTPNPPNTRKFAIKPLKLDLNSTDSADLRAVYGIGPVLSRRIIRYRNLLGGFYAMNQLSEVYGLDSLVLQRLNRKFLIKSNHQYHKLNLNTLDYRGLVRHPYLNAQQVEAILLFREQHGPFSQVQQLKEVHLIDDSTYIKLYPYLDF